MSSNSCNFISLDDLGGSGSTEDKFFPLPRITGNVGQNDPFNFVAGAAIAWKNLFWVDNFVLKDAHISILLYMHLILLCYEHEVWSLLLMGGTDSPRDLNRSDGTAVLENASIAPSDMIYGTQNLYSLSLMMDENVSRGILLPVSGCPCCRMLM